MQVLTQNLRLSAVQIRRHGQPEPVGTGFFVSKDGLVATCRHVIAAAGVVPETGQFAPNWTQLVLGRPGTRGLLDVYMPAVHEKRFHREGCLLQAVVSRCPPAPFADDVALVELLRPFPEISDDEVAAVGEGLHSAGSPFTAFGFRIRGQHDGGLPARGLILGYEGERFEEQKKRADLYRPNLAMRSPEIAPGMSGSPVLDLRSNLVVGVVEATWESGRYGKDRDLCWAVDGGVLAQQPLGVPVRTEPLPLQAAPSNDLDVDVGSLCAKNPGRRLAAAPQHSDLWVDRETLSALINRAWNGDDIRVIALVGFGGSGKSTLAARWIETAMPEPDGIFWWNFKAESNADIFFDASIAYLSGGQARLEEYRWPGMKTRLLARLLEGGRYLIVLDSLEAVQHQSGDLYGSFNNEYIRDFLRLFATPTHSSLCLVTTRAPLTDIENYSTYVWYGVDRMALEEGMALLRKSGVGAPDAILEGIIQGWNGHALALALIGGQLRGRETVLPHEVPRPTADATDRDRVEELLRSYDRGTTAGESLSEDERRVLFAISLFRIAPTVEAINRVVARMRGAPMDVSAILAGSLQPRRLVAPLEDGACYEEHPLVRDYYRERLEGTFPAIADLYREAGAFYEERAKEPPEWPNLLDLSDWIEAAWHFCRAGDYGRAYELYRAKLEQGNKLTLSWKLNAYSTITGILEAFYPDGRFDGNPQLDDAAQRRFVVNRLGVCRMAQGRLSEAVGLYEEAMAISVEAGMRAGELGSLENRIEAESYLGRFASARRRSDEAVRIAEELNEEDEIRDALAYRGYIADAIGELAFATDQFEKAEALQAAIEPEIPRLTSLYGLWHAEHLLHVGRQAGARGLTDFVLEHARSQRQLDDISMSWRVLGDIAAAQHDDNEAAKCFDEAVRQARAISEVTVLLEALRARGLWAARLENADALADLNEALNLARGGSYRPSEARIRLGRARVFAARGDSASARADFARALKLARETNYYWAIQEADSLRVELGI
jgi:tetratricopeptide (TPR) repeat protein